MTSTKYIPATKENLREEMLTFFFLIAAEKYLSNDYSLT